MLLQCEVRVKDKPQNPDCLKTQFCVYQPWPMMVSSDEDRKGVEKRMASVLSSLCLSWLLHILAFMSSVHDCRSCITVRLRTSFGGVDLWSWWLTKWFAMMFESGVVYKTNSTGPSTKPCGTPNMRGEEEEGLLTTTHWFLSRRYDQNHYRSVDQMPKTVLRWERRIWRSIVSNTLKDPVRAEHRFCLHP